MDFTPELSAFQGVIISADNVHAFSRLTEKGGNEEKISSIINNLFKFLKDKKMIDNGLVENMVPQVRKFALYIILNANLRTLEELVDKEEIDLVIWTIPTIPKLLMCELISNLYMEQFLYEVVVFSYPPLAIEVAAAFLDHLKYSIPTNCLEKLRKLSIACYTLICRLHFFNFGQNYSRNLTDAGNNFQKSIKYFTDPPSSEKLNTLHKNDLYKHKGKTLTAALLIVHECLTQFTNKQDKKPNGIDDLYQLTYLADTFKQDITSYNISDCPKEVLDLLNKCNETMLDTCKQLVMDVSVDIFCAWSEFEEDGKTMQQMIGELCHKLRTQLLSVSSVSEHPLINMMQQIARRPADIKDLINTSDVATIKQKINDNNYEESKQWLHALIDKVHLCNYIDLLDIINTNIENLDEKECLKLYEVLKKSSLNKNYTDVLAVKAFHQCTLSVKYDLLDKQFNANCFTEMQESTEFQLMMTETFNKLVMLPDADYSHILTLFLQNPRKVYSKIFSLALESPQQTDIMLKAIRLLEKYSNYYYDSETEPCIIKVMQTTFELDLAMDNKQMNFIRFVSGLKDIDIIPGTKLLLLFLMPNMHKALLDTNVDSLHIQIKLLTDAYTLQDLMQYRAPMLAMLAQVLDVVRWNMHSFTLTTPVTLQSAIDLQKLLIDTYNNSVPDNEGSWLRSKINKSHPLTMYYYRKLWNPPGNNFLEIVSGIWVSRRMNIDHLRRVITRLLYSCTQQEWCDTWDSLSVLEDTTVLGLFHDAAVMVCAAEELNTTYNAWTCVIYCCRNYLYIIRYKFFKEPLTNAQVIAATKKISTLPIIKKAKPDVLEPLLLPLFSYLAERRNDYTFDLLSSSHLKHGNIANLLERVFNRSSL